MSYIVSEVVKTDIKATLINLYFSRYFHYFHSGSGMNSGTRKSPTLKDSIPKRITKHIKSGGACEPE